MDGRRLALHLVKNPAGLPAVPLHTLDGASPAAIVIAINDDYADGRDVSWLWDVDFAPALGRVAAARLSTSGIRAADMALRLKYDGIEVDSVEVDPSRSAASGRQRRLPASRFSFSAPTPPMWTLCTRVAPGSPRRVPVAHV